MATITDQTVEQIMSTELIKVGVKESIHKVRELMDVNHIRHVPVLKEQKLVGILSLTDLQRLSFGGSFNEFESEIDESISTMLVASQVMKSDPVTVTKENTVREVAEILSTKEFHALPVVDGDALVGIVTTTDIIKLLLEE